MKTYNFFLDIDETLVPGGRREISENNLKALKTARACGCKVFVNTGRPYCTVYKDVFTEEYFDGILSGGDYAEYHGQVIYSHFMPREDIRALLTDLMGESEPISFNIGGLAHRYYIGEKRANYKEGIYIPLSSPTDFDTVFKEESLQKYVVAESLPPNHEAFKVLDRYFTSVIHPSYTEGFLLGEGKAFLIKKVEEALSLPHASTVAIGDSLNDTDMLRYASLSVAMGNAPDVVKELCDTVTDTCERDGVAKIIYSLLEKL